MIKTQIQIPDNLYREVRRVAREREISLAEVVRRGLEYIVRVYPPLPADAPEWTPPQPRSLGSFQAPVDEWRLLAVGRPSDRPGQETSVRRPND